MKGLNGSAWRAILRTFDTGLALAPGVGDVVPVGVCVHALRTSAAMAATMTGHPVFRANMNLSLQRKADVTIKRRGLRVSAVSNRVEFARTSPSTRVMTQLGRLAALSLPRASDLFKGARPRAARRAYLDLLFGVKFRA
jgi:hypothetical protein